MADENNTTESNERTITVKGTFNNVVRISDSFANGQNCTCGNDGNTLYSHAEGYNSSATGKYSHADGYCAKTTNDYSYVWSGCTKTDVEKIDNNQGTFSIYGTSTDANMLSTYKSVTGGDDRFDNNADLLSYMRQTCASNVYVNGIRLSDTLNTIKRWAVKTIRSESNTFSGTSFIFGKNKDDDKNYNGEFIINQSVSTNINGDTTIGGKLTTSGNITITKPNTNNNICAQVLIPATFNDSVVFNNSPTITSLIDSGTNDNTVATCKFVHAVVQDYLKAALGDNIIKN